MFVFFVDLFLCVLGFNHGLNTRREMRNFTVDRRELTVMKNHRDMFSANVLGLTADINSMDKATKKKLIMDGWHLRKYQRTSKDRAFDSSMSASASNGEYSETLNNILNDQVLNFALTLDKEIEKASTNHVRFDYGTDELGKKKRINVVKAVNKWKRLVS